MSRKAKGQKRGTWPKQSAVAKRVGNIGKKKASTHRGSGSQTIFKIVEKLIALMSKPGSGIDSEDVERFRAKAAAVWNYTPTICLFGMTGAGKSTLCNALFGKNVFETSAVQACTMRPQSHTIEVDEKRRLTVIDMPGVGESDEADLRYQALYEESVQKADLVLWALKADARNFASDQRTWKLVNAQVEELCLPAFFVLTQADKVDPSDNWSKRMKQPGDEQMGTLLLKRKQVAKDFKLSPNNVLFVSAPRDYGLKELVMTILLALPDEKKTGFLKLTRPENQTEQAKREASRGFWSAILTWCKESAAAVGEFAWKHRKEVIEIAAIVAQVLLKKKIPRRR